MRPTTGGPDLVSFRSARALGVESEEDEPAAAAEEGVGVGTLTQTWKISSTVVSK